MTVPFTVESNSLKFSELVNVWVAETVNMSSLTDMISHPAYRDIIAIGWPAVPLLLAELRKRPNFWFPALMEITDENPVSDREAGDVAKMTSLWLLWGIKTADGQNPPSVLASRCGGGGEACSPRAPGSKDREQLSKSGRGSDGRT